MLMRENIVEETCDGENVCKEIPKQNSKLQSSKENIVEADEEQVKNKETKRE